MKIGQSRLSSECIILTNQIDEGPLHLKLYQHTTICAVHKLGAIQYNNT